MSTDRPWLEGEFAAHVDALKATFRALDEDLGAAAVEPATREQLRQVAQQLDELFLLVIVGEFNSGKSSMINALFGSKICPEGPVPTTDKINVLKYGETSVERHVGDFIVERFFPYEPLKTLNIVDTPGTNSIVRQHQVITQNFIPRADLVLFVTSVDRPYSQSERTFLELIAERWRKKVFFVLTKIDTQDEEDVRRVVAFIKQNCRDDFGFEPMVIPISPKLAYNGRVNGDDVLFARSRLAELEEYLFVTLSDAEKLTLKVSSPIEAGLRICEDVLAEFRQRLALMEEHSQTLTRVEKLVTDRARSIKDGYTKHLLAIKNLLTSVENRGSEYFDDKVQLANLWALRDRSRFKADFDDLVVRRFTDDLEAILSKATDEVVRSEMMLWNDALNEYNHWVERHSGGNGPEFTRVATDFDYNREQIVAQVQQQWQATLNRFNPSEQAGRIHDDVAKGVNTVLATWLFGAAAIALGIVANAGEVAVVLGIVAGLAIGAISLFVMPSKRRRAVQSFRKRFQDVHESLISALQDSIEDEVQTLKGKLAAKLAPAKAHFEGLREEIEAASGRIATHAESLRHAQHALQALIDTRFAGAGRTLFAVPGSVSDNGDAAAGGEGQEIQDSDAAPAPDKETDRRTPRAEG